MALDDFQTSVLLYGLLKATNDSERNELLTAAGRISQDEVPAPRKLYQFDFDARTLTTSTCKLIDRTLFNKPGNTFEQNILDLCLCEVEAIQTQDVQAKQAIGYALYLVLGAAFDQPNVEDIELPAN